MGSAKGRTFSEISVSSPLRVGALLRHLEFSEVTPGLDNNHLSGSKKAPQKALFLDLFQQVDDETDQGDHEWRFEINKHERLLWFLRHIPVDSAKLVRCSHSSGYLAPSGACIQMKGTDGNRSPSSFLDALVCLKT
jgi:hypothetical protein